MTRRLAAKPGLAAGFAPRRGVFIAFEGIDGCGKGTAMRGVAGLIFELGKEYDVLMTREPTAAFSEIRRRLRKGMDPAEDSRWYARNFVADRRFHVKRLIEPALASGAFVLCDRFALSTLAYQHTQGIPLKELLTMHEGIIVPDLTILFDCPSKKAFLRRQKAGATDVFDKDSAFLSRLRDNYLMIARRRLYPRIRVVDSGMDAESVLEAAMREIERLLPKMRRAGG